MLIFISLSTWLTKWLFSLKILTATEDNTAGDGFRQLKMFMTHLPATREETHLRKKWESKNIFRRTEIDVKLTTWNVPVSCIGINDL